MSADLYASEIDSDKHGDLFLEMKVGGNLRMVAIDPGNGDGACFSLPPTPEGWKEAENLIGALQEWVLHTKEIHMVKKNVDENKCENCSDGIIQHTSFPSHDGSDELTVHVYGCNRCENGWSVEEER